MEPARKLESRPTARPDRLAAISVAERSLAAQGPQWLGLVAIACAAVLADQLTKQLVIGTLALDEQVAVVGPFSIHRLQNAGIAFGFFSSATSVVIVLTAVA